MKHSSVKLSLLGLALIALAACAQPDLGISPMIPENALAFVQVTDPELFITNMDAFIQPLGISKMTGNLGIKDMLSLGLKSGAELDMSALDLKKPLGMALLPPLTAGGEFRYIVYIPLTKSAESTPKLNKLFEQMPGISSATINGYGIYYSGTEKLNFPPTKALKVSENLKFEPGTLTAYTDLRAWLGQYKSEWAVAKESAIKESSSLETGMESTKAVTKNLLEGVFTTIEQIQGFAINLKADATGLRLANLVDFSTDGTVSKLLKDIGPGAGVTTQSKYLPSGYLMLAALSGNSGAFKDMYKNLMALYMDLLKVDDKAKTAFGKMLDDSFKVMGKNASFGLDVKLDPKIQGLSPSMLDANFADLFTLNMVSVLEVSSGEEYNKLLAEMVSGGTMKQYLDSLLKSTGFSMTMEITDQKEADFAWKEMKYDLQVSDPDKIDLNSESARKAAGMFAGIMQKLNIVFATKGNKVYMVMGETAPAKLKKLVTEDQVENSAEKNAAWKSYFKTVPADAQYVGNLSVGRIVDLVNLATGNAYKLEIKDADRSGIFSYVRIGARSIDSANFWDIKEITPLTKELIAQFGGVFGQ